ncbi:hypothetical protein JQ597_35015 [Bradyrhizobium sp. AUGA SZCCT0177]|uniref:hypothetical protein n=1 Tax=Bradyrhizobium sp. AUGA SZCCT0177 TaxID=2807665 RepID=UPI001BAC1FED|nr:hypothetical protein [Bradyrhizobium sp. AUGA SZCCT0177]MBR1287279.1 hypothetical protein [Bradyrhizobium sp. AUGA SZCCT0177]
MIAPFLAQDEAEQHQELGSLSLRRLSWGVPHLVDKLVGRPPLSVLQLGQALLLNIFRQGANLRPAPIACFSRIAGRRGLIKKPTTLI